MNKHSKYRPLMDDIQDKICNAEIGVTGLYRLMLETLDEAEQELATIKASLPKIKADAVLLAKECMVISHRGRSPEFERGFDKALELYDEYLDLFANKLEAGE